MIHLMKSLAKAVTANPVATILLAVVITLAVNTAVLKHRAAASAFTADSLGLVVLNAEARATAAVLSGDSAVRVLAVQHQLETDSLERLLGIADARFRAAVAAKVDTQYVETTVAFDSTFRLDAPPFHLVAQLAKGPPMELRGTFSLDSVVLGITVGCSEPVPPRNLRHAMVAVQGPPWLPVTVSQPEAAEGVCNPRFEQPKVSGGTGVLRGVGTGVVAGAAAGLVADRTVVGAGIGAVVGGLLGWLIATVF